MLSISTIVCLLISIHCFHALYAQKIVSIRQNYLEEQATGTIIFNLKEDLLPSIRNEVSFKLISQYMTSNTDTIDRSTEWIGLDERSGIVRVKKPVDREVDCGRDEPHQQCVIHITIKRRPESHFQLITLNLVVTDKNDHAPEFPQPSIMINVSESSPVSTRINLDRFLATDKDAGNNADIRYELSSNRFFGLHQRKDETGAPHLELVVADDLDHETSRFEDMKLTAIDRGTPIKSSYVNMRVRITDANDNAPVFEKTIYTVHVRENLPVDSVITTVVAHDDDSSKFGNIRYGVAERGNTNMGRNLVRIDPTSGRVLLNSPLNHARHNNIRIALAATDSNGPEKKIGKTILQLVVADVNDHTPEIRIDIIAFSKNNIAYVSEGAKIGSFVAQVSASDADTGVNGRVVIEISARVTRVPWLDDEVEGEDADNYFILTEGHLIATANVFDRETYPGFVINVKACDSAIPKRCSSKNLTMMLLDENDNFPVFDQHLQRRELQEGSKIGTVVATVSAADHDNLYKPSYRLAQGEDLVESRSGEVRYSLQGGLGCFVIDELSGKIKVAAKLDYESKPAWLLTVTATDEGIPSKSTVTNLTVDVVNINDNAPFFIKPSVNNSSATATIVDEDIIMTIEARDDDMDGILYSIVLEDGKAPKEGRKFILDKKSGILRLNLSNPSLNNMIGEHNLKVKAQDSGSPPLAGYTSLRVMVTDLPLNQLQALRERLKKSEEDPAKEDFTVVWIASLATVTVLLIVVLTGVVVKCRKDNKEIRTYNCRTAESRQGWQLGLSQQELARDVKVKSSNHIMSSRDSNLNSTERNETKRRFSFNAEHHTVKCQTTDCVSELAHRSLERKLSSFSSPAHPSLRKVLVTDGDSGRGDSDHDTGSCEEKEYLNTANLPVVHYQHEEGDVAIMELSASNDMGPLCTSSCLEYGHSDACWMNVYGSTPVPQNLVASPTEVLPPFYPYPVSCNIATSPRMLEPICETQPLHSVLECYDDEDRNNMSCALGENDNAELLPQTMYYNTEATYAREYTLPYQHKMHFSVAQSSMSNHYDLVSAYRTGSPDPRSNGNRPSSVSDLFHDGASAPAPSSESYGNQSCSPFQHTSMNMSPSSFTLSPSVSAECGRQRRSVASLHGELLHKKFLSVAQGTSLPEAQPADCGNVSMQETQQIINDIDNLIDQ